MECKKFQEKQWTAFNSHMCQNHSKSNSFRFQMVSRAARLRDRSDA